MALEFVLFDAPQPRRKAARVSSSTMTGLPSVAMPFHVLISPGLVGFEAEDYLRLNLVCSRLRGRCSAILSIICQIS